MKTPKFWALLFSLAVMVTLSGCNKTLSSDELLLYTGQWTGPMNTMITINEDSTADVSLNIEGFNLSFSGAKVYIEDNRIVFKKLVFKPSFEIITPPTPQSDGSTILVLQNIAQTTGGGSSMSMPDLTLVKAGQTR